MRKKTKLIVLTFLIVLFSGIIYIFTYVPDLSEQHGIVETQLYIGDAESQPLIVAFGGGDGGNDWTRRYLKEKRDSLNQKGYALLAIGYFKSYGTPKYLDRISLDAIRDSILAVARHPKIDASKIILLGGSRGGELALNLASRYRDFKGVIAMSTSHVSFPAITWTANTSSWTYRDEEVPYVPAPFKTVLPALKGELYTAHTMMLEDKEAVEKAAIAVEKINGPILLLSGKNDEQWPALEMSTQIVNRLKNKRYRHHFSHVELDGGHVAPLENFNFVYAFLEKHFPSE